MVSLHRYPLAVLLLSTHCLLAQQTVSAVCEGEQLRSLASGCLSADDCRATAEAMGMQIGSEQYGFAGDWDPKGCVYYPFSNQAYFGIAGTCEQLQMTPDDGSVRLDCTTGALMDQPPVVVDESGGDNSESSAVFDVSNCEDVLCGTSDDCRAVAGAMNLQLGSDLYAFEGDYPVKGCHYFPASDPNYGNQIYWGNGGTTCGDFTANPSDGSQRPEACGGSAAAAGGVTTPTESDVSEEDVVPSTGTPDAADATSVPTDVLALDDSSGATVATATTSPTASPTNVVTGVPTNMVTVATAVPTDLPTVAATLVTPNPTADVLVTEAPSPATVAVTDDIATVSDPTSAPEEIVVVEDTGEDGASVNIPTTEAPTETPGDDNEAPAIETEAPTEAPKNDKNGADDKNNNDKQQNDRNQVDNDKEEDEDDEDDEDEDDDEFGSPSETFIAPNGTEAVFGTGQSDRSDAAIAAINNGEIISGAKTTSVGLGAMTALASLMIMLTLGQ